MSDVFVGLEDAATFEGISYKGLTSRIARNPQQYITKTQPREGGGKDQVMISVASLSPKGRRAWRAAQKVDGRDVVINKRTDEPPWYVGTDLNHFIEGDGGKRKKAEEGVLRGRRARRPRPGLHRLRRARPHGLR